MNMDIYMVVKKEKKYFKIFLVIMFIILIIFFVVLILIGLINVFYIGYLIFIEFLIVIVVIVRFNLYSVKYRCMNNKLIFKIGIFIREYLIICDRVVLVYINKLDYDLEILIIINVVFKNKVLRKVESDFLKRYL